MQNLALDGLDIATKKLKHVGHLRLNFLGLVLVFQAERLVFDDLRLFLVDTLLRRSFRLLFSSHFE